MVVGHEQWNFPPRAGIFSIFTGSFPPPNADVKKLSVILRDFFVLHWSMTFGRGGFTSPLICVLFCPIDFSDSASGAGGGR